MALVHRLRQPLRAVIPFDGTSILSGVDDRIEYYPGLAAWRRSAEQVWIANRSSGRLTLNEQIDYMNKLRNQFPIAPIRVVYTKAGNHLTSAIVTDEQAVIDHKLYWEAVATMDEAFYLTTVLNAPLLIANQVAGGPRSEISHFPGLSHSFHRSGRET